MKKWLTIVLSILLSIQVVNAICCEKNKDCIIAETCQDAACGNCSVTVYNRTGGIIIPSTRMDIQNQYLYIINVSKNLTNYDTYPYAINCTNNKVCQGDCQVEIKTKCEGDNKMITSITIFLILFNLLLFALPFLVRFSRSQVTNYMIKHLIWISCVFILWFNITIFRDLAIDYGLGIDNYLIVYWWMLTIICFGLIFVMVYVMTRGMVGLIQEANLRKRMGEDEYQKTGNV